MIDVAAIRDNAQEWLWRSARMWVAGAAFIVVMFVVCVATLPYTAGMTYDPTDPNPNSVRRPRLDEQALDANLLPPGWVTYSPDDQAKFDRYMEKVKAASAATGRPVKEPSFILGTDSLGRDYLTRVLAGGGISLGIGIAAAAMSVIIGTGYGMIAGFAGGRLDSVMMRFVDVLYGLPYILLVVLLSVAVNGAMSNLQSNESKSKWMQALGDFLTHHDQMVNLITLFVAIGGVSWLTMARVIRGQVLSLRNQPFMEACRAIGVPTRTQLIRHLLPNLLGPIIVYATLTVPQAILQESFLSFLGIGVRAPLPSWGNLAADGLTQLNTVHSRWWLLLWPCLLLGLTLLALNFVGEGLREAFDPRRRSSERGE